MRLCFDPTMPEPRWLIILREHRYDLDSIADPAMRSYVLNSLRANRIEVLRGDSGTYSTRDMSR